MSTALDRWPPRIRSMTLQDLDTVYDIERRAYEFPWTRGIFVDCLRIPYVCEILEDGGIVVGYAIMSLGGDEAHLLNFCLDEPARGRGLAAMMLEHLFLKAMREGVRVLYLEVRPSNAAAIALYRKAGFARIGVRKSYYRAADGREDAWVFARSL